MRTSTAGDMMLKGKPRTDFTPTIHTMDSPITVRQVTTPGTERSP
ncbi:MAG: hypothetical protein BWX71_02520 [Deltaproteobacteria bacterium ADurb.Bin072]|nr:MAG: hypothetical protein BWX71_02520 [Deltaproteobacteria bacterium ADurb.Bin072]